MSTRKYRKRGGPAKALAVSVGKITRPIFSRRGFADGAIIKEWQTIVGQHLGAHSAPEKITYPAHETTAGTLHLRMDNGGLAMELQHLQPQMIERINGYFGFNAIAHIKITQGPLPEPTTAPQDRSVILTTEEEASVSRSLQGVKDTDLDQALRGLGRAVIKLRKSEK